MKTGSTGIENKFSVFSQLTLESRKLVTKEDFQCTVNVLGHQGAGLAQQENGRLVKFIDEVINGQGRDY